MDEVTGCFFLVWLGSTLMAGFKVWLGETRLGAVRDWAAVSAIIWIPRLVGYLL